ncbi:unnamed protein product [Clonostachys rosea f. rosea IK726]|uniref:Zn(2)-C6 fungal-type domain-containing protein n=3 Tax=Bionectria ochroleuca TaxID=29856 RepID=A0A0B7JHQ0_BIOOC|nr:unnamed protein product [Clonostachys rosea f. rosea IK726]
MPSHGPPSPNVQPAKRQRQSSFDDPSPRDGQTSPSDQLSEAASAGAGSQAAKSGQSSNFRNVSACNRCRLRKNRCDQRLPSCASCAKAGVACVGYDPITKKEIPRSYVYYLETRVEQLENLLKYHDITFPPAESLDTCSRPSNDTTRASTVEKKQLSNPVELENRVLSNARNHSVDTLNAKKSEQSPAMLNIVSPSKPRSLASTSGVSFARVVFAAVQYSVADQNGSSDRPGTRQPSIGGHTSMRDSFFGLHTKPTIKPAPFPSREVGLRLVTLYFEHANPQIPILHRGEFMNMFERAYANPAEVCGARESYMLNMVFAIGCGVIVGEPVKTEASGDGPSKGQSQPEEYHASAIVHLESCLSNSGGGLEVLQAVLLLANFALLRPVPPGLWYIIGVAVRLAVDLGLHHEDSGDSDTFGDVSDADQSNENRPREGSAQERGRRLWLRDMRRRLWWCTYSFDRLVSTCVGRPFGVSDQVITMELPSLLDDDYITPASIIEPSPDERRPSYKHVAHHYFRLRMLQSEILQVLQYNQTQIARAHSTGIVYPEMHTTHLPSPFLVKFDSYRSWRRSIDERLLNWKLSAPTRHETGVAFSTEFLELNYWQAIILLYRQSLSVPAMFEGEYNTSNEVDSPRGFTTTELREDEDRIYIKVAEAGQKILRIYRQLHLSGLVSYTYLSTHHLFTAGISYLYAIWHSPLVRSRLTMDEVDFTVLAAKSVFTDMIDKCPPAETCRDAFDRTARATIKMANANGGFGNLSDPQIQRTQSNNWGSTSDTSGHHPARHRSRPSDQQQFQFDLSLSDNLSSPTLSIAGDVSRPSPPVSVNKNFETDYGMSARSGQSPADRIAANRDAPGPSMASGGRRLDPIANTSGSGNHTMSQQFGLQGTMDYPDAHSMDFLQDLGARNGAFGNMDQNQVDLGFGLNWEVPNEYGEGQQQMNPFDTFFFGGQQGGNSNGGGMGM